MDQQPIPDLNFTPPHDQVGDGEILDEPDEANAKDEADEVVVQDHPAGTFSVKFNISAA